MFLNLEKVTSEFPNLSNLELIDRGGQKLVFKCNNPQYGICALKLILPEAASRLDREIEAVNRLNQTENIPKIYWATQKIIDQQLIFFLLEQFIEGQTLHNILLNGPIEKELVLRIANDLTHSIYIMDSNSIAHRDIKPKNIIVDNNGKVWILDFGIARILDLTSKTRDSALWGPQTPGYGAPEQIRNEKTNIDGRTDLFSTGIVLFECCTGYNPFYSKATSKHEVFLNVLRKPLPKLDIDWDTHYKFQEFVSSITQKYQFQRPSCAEASKWISEISNALGGDK